jgi:glycosyltransferase involved in cell wall biosynthesis
MSCLNFESKKRHLVLIGLNFTFFRKTGDKNFWFELLPYIAKSFERISIYSIRKHVQELERIDLNGTSVTIKYLPPKFLETPSVEYSRPKVFWKEGAFPSFYGVIEKFLNIKKLRIELKYLYAQQPFSQIHLMDNLGFGNKFIASLQLAPVSVSAMAYKGENTWIYDNYLKQSYKHENLTVVPYSEAYSEKLIQLGIKKEKVVRISWGASSVLTSYDKGKIKKSLMLPGNKPLLLWAGYTQQIQKEDFYFALKTAKEALAKGLDVTFLFAFKPECYEKEFLGITQDRSIIVKPTQVDEFMQLRKCADILFSPVQNKRCILAPPLTWIEFLSHGVPIITTNVPGVSEIIVDGKNGCVGENEEELLSKMFSLIEKYSDMSSYCRKKIEESYNIQKSAQKYINLWLK